MFVHTDIFQTAYLSSALTNMS